MWMNIMDYSPDNCMYMFTTDQANRIQTTMANGTYRKNLSTYAQTECSTASSTVAPTAAFTPPSNICVGVATVFNDASTGSPTSWTWSVTPTTATITTATSQNPSITFGAASTYTVSLTATNSNGSNSVSHTVTVSSCTSSASCDTLSNINPADTLTYYGASTGYLSGNGVYTTTTTTTYTTKKIGEVYTSSIYPTNITQVKGVMLVCFRDAANNVGTKGTGSFTVAMTNTGTDGGGATVPGTTTLATTTVSLSSVVASPNVAGIDYAGNTIFNFTGYMKAYPVMFSSPVTMPSTFGISITLPTASGDTLVVWSNDEYTANTSGLGTGCVNLKPSSSTSTVWYNVNTAFGLPVSFGIVPIACSASTGIEHNELGNSINVFPNPNNGVFNFAVTMPQATDLNLTVINTLGQVVYTHSENNVTNTVIGCNLNGLARGVYYANITDGNGNRTIKKIVIE
jgi:PKD repeat protein